MQLLLWRTPKDGQENKRLTKLKENISVWLPCMRYCIPRSLNYLSLVAKLGLNPSAHSEYSLLSGCFISYWAPPNGVNTDLYP